MDTESTRGAPAPAEDAAPTLSGAPTGDAAPSQELPSSVPAETRPRSGLSNLTLRLLTAAALIPPVLWVTYAGGLPFVLVILGISVLGINEFYSFIAQKGATPHRLLGTVAAGLIPLIVYYGDSALATNFLTFVLLTTMILQLTKQEIREAIASVSVTFFGIFYVAWLMSHAISIRFLYQELEGRYGAFAVVSLDPEIGVFFMVYCVAAFLGCDAGAYFVGRQFGRRPLAPGISPKKSVEGAVGGVLIGSVLAVLIKLFFDYLWPEALSEKFARWAAFWFGIAVASSGVIGDLIESLLKRDAAVKDAGRLLPGVGGVLDRIDSALLAFPVLYYLLLAYYYFHLS